MTGTFPWSSALTHPRDETKHVSKASEVKRSPIPQRSTQSDGGHLGFHAFIMIGAKRGPILLNDLEYF